MAFSMASANPPSLRMAKDSNNATSPVPTESSPPSITSPRSLKQLSLFFAGASFFAFSSLITRRALVRRYHATVPRFYVPSNRPLANTVNGPFEAVEALSLATINVTSFMMMMAGGTLWVTDISSVDDMRRKLKGELGVDGIGRTERLAEEEFEERLAETLAKKGGKRKKTGVEEEQRMNERGKPR